jgi:hypothetical protein
VSALQGRKIVAVSHDKEVFTTASGFLRELGVDTQYESLHVPQRPDFMSLAGHLYDLKPQIVMLDSLFFDAPGENFVKVYGDNYATAFSAPVCWIGWSHDSGLLRDALVRGLLHYNATSRNRDFLAEALKYYCSCWK